MALFMGLVGTLLSNIAIGQFTAQKVFIEEGWWLVELRMHLPNQADTITLVGKATGSVRHITTTVLNMWARGLNANPSATRIAVRRGYEHPYPMTYIFEKISTSIATEAAEGEAEPA